MRGNGGVYSPAKGGSEGLPSEALSGVGFSMILERGRAIDTKEKICDRISDMKNDDLDMTGGIGVRPCPVRWQPQQRVEVWFVVLECEQPCVEREHEHRGEPILSNDGAFNQKHTFFLHRRMLEYI